MIDLIIKNYQVIIGLIGSLTGLLGLAITFYSKYRDSNIKEKELELKKEQFELDKKHQISKEKYQELFEKKIDVYQKLYEEINKLRMKSYDIGKYFDELDDYGEIVIEELKLEEVNVSTLLNLFKEIEKNNLVISTTLIEMYKKLYDLYRKSNNEFEFMLEYDALSDPKKEWSKIQKTFYDTYKDLIEKFFCQIEKEINEMKKILES